MTRFCTARRDLITQRNGVAVRRSYRRTHPIANFGGAVDLASAVGAAEKAAVDFDAMPDDHAAAVLADGRHLMDRALERIEDMLLAGSDDLERLVVVVPTDFAFRHFLQFLLDPGNRRPIPHCAPVREEVLIAGITGAFLQTVAVAWNRGGWDSGDDPGSDVRRHLFTRAPSSDWSANSLEPFNTLLE